MNLDEIRRIAWENMGKRRSHSDREEGYIYFHGLRVANLAGELLYLRGGNHDRIDDVLIAGGLFHDIGKGFGAHNESGAEITRHLLGDFCTPDELNTICDIVRFHCIRKHQLELPDHILAIQDADIIDHFGTQCVWLHFLHAANQNLGQSAALEYWQGEKYAEHMAELMELLNFSESKDIFTERLEYLRGFADRFQIEMEGRIVSGAPKTGETAVERA